MAMVPANRQVDIEAINRKTNRLLSPAGQRDVNLLFRDCSQGAVPGLGQPYNIPTIWDDSLAEQPECFLEAGDHKELVQLNKEAFNRSVSNLPHARICI